MGKARCHSGPSTSHDEEIEEFSPEESRFRLDACLKKMLGKPLSENEREVIADVNRRNGWDKK